MLKRILLLVILLTLCSCTKNNGFAIKPIDKTLNERLLTGKGLDPALFSTTDSFQYYEIQDAQNLSDKDLLSKINDFVQRSYLKKNIKLPNHLNVFFYRTNLFSNYSNNVYEAARDNESGRINDENNNLLAMCILTQTGNNADKIKRNTVIFDNEEIVMDVTAMVPLK